MFTLLELADLAEARLIGDPQLIIRGVADLETAQDGHISFFSNRRYLDAMKKSSASAIIVDESAPLEEGKNYLIAPHASEAFQKVLKLFFGDRSPLSFSGIHPTAVLAPDVTLGNNVTIGPHVVIDKGSSIGHNTTISSGVLIGPHVTIGDNCLLHSGVVIREHCHIGHRVVIQPSAVIGSCGFGFFTDEKGVHHKLDQYGSVVIEDDVEIGSLTAIDRGRFTETRICRGSKIDNLVQIAHGVTIGPYNLIIAQSGIAGSSKTGSHVVMAGQSALVGHLQIADRVIIAARGAVSKSINEPGSRWAGAPAEPLTEHHRRSVHLRNIAKYVKKIEELDKRLAQLEAPLKEGL